MQIRFRDSGEEGIEKMKGQLEALSLTTAQS